MAEELLRRGDLVLMLWSYDEVGLFREGADGWRRFGPGDRAEWRWVLTCAAPLALQVLGPEPDVRDASPGPVRGELEQTALRLDGAEISP